MGNEGYLIEGLIINGYEIIKAEEYADGHFIALGQSTKEKNNFVVERVRLYEDGDMQTRQPRYLISKTEALYVYHDFLSDMYFS